MNNDTTKIESQPGCIEHALKIIGNKWTGLIVRELSDGPKRFCQVEHSLNGISPRTLAQRFRDLEREKIIIKQSVGEYALAAKGIDLIPVLEQMAAWGTKHPQ